MKRFFLLIPLLLLSILFAGCSGDNAVTGEQVVDTNATGVSGTEVDTGPQDLGSVETLGFSGKPMNRGLPARLGILRPTPEQVIASGKADIFFQPDNYYLTPGGNSIRYILNNGTPVTFAQRNAPASVSGLADGGQTLRAWFVTPDGLALRNPEAFTMLHFYVKRKDFQNYVSPNGPLLTVNQPSGRYEGEMASKIFLDVLLNHAPADQYTVRYTLNGSTKETSGTEPVPLGDLDSGTYRIVVELVKKDGKIAPGPYNKVERTFTVVRPAPVATTPPAPDDLMDTPPPEPSPAPAAPDAAPQAP